MKKFLLLLTLLTIFFSACQNTQSNTNLVGEKNLSKAYFAGGCFWCSESQFEKYGGVVNVVSGYLGGKIKNPTYKQVSSGKTKHREGILIYYNKTQISYEKLLEIFWTHIDPKDSGGSFADRGFQYSTAIFYTNEEQKKLAEKSKEFLSNSLFFKNKTIATEILPFTTFYKAEKYHQNYYKNNPIQYNVYRKASGRDSFIEEFWENFSFENFTKPSDEELKEKLTELQYFVTQKNGTEKPFINKYHKKTDEGIYVDIVSGEPLFSSKDKFISKSGWPSFTKPINENVVTKHKDTKFFLTRIEVRSKIANSHLGHIFEDGPKEKGGKRYCINSAALLFIPKEKLKERGYEKFLKEFDLQKN